MPSKQYVAAAHPTGGHVTRLDLRHGNNSREDIFSGRYFREKKFSREDISAGRYLRLNSIFAKISSRENISNSLFAKISSHENNHRVYSRFPRNHFHIHVYIILFSRRVSEILVVQPRPLPLRTPGSSFRSCLILIGTHSSIHSFIHAFIHLSKQSHWAG